MKLVYPLSGAVKAESPSTRREWIEIVGDTVQSFLYQSPSTRREWIDIGCK